MRAHSDRSPRHTLSQRHILAPAVGVGGFFAAAAAAAARLS
jgi:hypothetical protein